MCINDLINLTENRPSWEPNTPMPESKISVLSRTRSQINKKLEQSQNSKHQKGNMKPVPYLTPTNIRRDRTIRIRHGDPKHKVYAPLHYHIHKCTLLPLALSWTMNYDVGLMGCNNTIHTLVYITSYTYRNHSTFKRRQAASKKHRPKRKHEVKTREDYETSLPFKDWPTLKTTSPSGTSVQIYQSHGGTYQYTNLQVIHVSVGFMLLGDLTASRNPDAFFPP